MTATGRFIWDERKRAANQAKHGVDFAIVERFEFDTALCSPTIVRTTASHDTEPSACSMAASMFWYSPPAANGSE